MNFLIYLSEILIPFLTAIILSAGLFSKQNIFDQFCDGVMNGLITVKKLIPTLIGLLISVNVLRQSGLLTFIGNGLTEIFHFFSITFFPKELIPLSLIKMVSGSAANGLLLDIFKEYGTDTFIGLTASIMMSCSETILYCYSIYFGSVHITKTRWALPFCILASLTDIFISIILASYFL